MLLLIMLLIAAANSVIIPQTNDAAISGKVINAADKNPLPNCNILIKETTAGTISGYNGEFEIKLPYGEYTLVVSYLGYEKFEKVIRLYGGNKRVSLLIELKQAAVLGKEVTVTGDRKPQSVVVQEIKQTDIKHMPSVYGDVLRAVQILPGVTSNNELTSGYNVRGGSFDENLIYLDGFEIYRPLLLRQGIEENKSLINPDLVDEIRFYNGSFPASFGDKMSSVLEANYNIHRIDGFSGAAKADLLNSALTLKSGFGNLKLAGAARYAYPGMFLDGLQTNGDYRPKFLDVQMLANYSLTKNTEIEALFIGANNEFDLTPSDWKGNFGGFYRGDYRGLDIFYDGEREYSFKTYLTGVKFTSVITDDVKFKLSAARYSSAEKEFSNLHSDYYYYPDAGDTQVSEYVKSSYENVDNKLDLVSYNVFPEISVKKGKHLFTAGLNIRLADMNNNIDERFIESADSVSSDYPLDRTLNESFKLNSYSAFIQDEYYITSDILLNGGMRFSYSQYNEEFLASPRINSYYVLSPKHRLSFNWGYYYQPTYYSELRNKTNEEGKKLKAQRSINYSAGWEYQFKEKLNLNVQAYYKDLDRLIPYYVEREKTEYLAENSNEGYAYGLDLMVQGEIIEGMNSWIGYGYLNTKERKKNSGEAYSRRLTDQTHTIRIFLQDKIKKHPNWQSHLRLLFGSGYLYNVSENVVDAETGKTYIKTSVNKLDEFLMYFRVDMGLSASFNTGASQNLLVVAEVLNVFDHNNFGGYRFVQIAAENPLIGQITKTTFSIPQILSKRFFNLGLEFNF
jgi:hypothetical protein